MSVNSSPITAHDVAVIGSRLAAILIGGRLLAALPQVPMDIAYLKQDSSLRNNVFDSLTGSTALGLGFHLVLIPLLGVACMVLWYKADFVARSIVQGTRPPVRRGSTGQDIVGAFVVVAGWIMLMYSIENVASFITHAFQREILPLLVSYAGTLLVFFMGLFLVAGRKFFVRLWGGPSSYDALDGEPGSFPLP